MRKLSMMAILALFCMTSIAQKRDFKIEDKSLLIKPTEIAAKKFTIKEVKTAYELALNFSYLHHQSTGSKSEFLTLPIVLIDDHPVFENHLKEIKISKIALYSFKGGESASAIYGARGSYGVLTIKLKQND